MTFLKTEVLFYYDGPDVVALIGYQNVIALLDIEDYTHYGVVVSNNELLRYVQGSLDLRTLFNNGARNFVKVELSKNPLETTATKIEQNQIPEEMIPSSGSFYMLAHRESGKELVAKISALLHEVSETLASIFSIGVGVYHPAREPFQNANSNDVQSLTVPNDFVKAERAFAMFSINPYPSAFKAQLLDLTAHQAPTNEFSNAA